MSEIVSGMVHQRSATVTSDGAVSDWVIHPDPDAPPQFYVVTCMDCQQGSADEDPVDPKKWGITHATTTGHPKYSYDVRSFLVVLKLPEKGEQ